MESRQAEATLSQLPDLQIEHRGARAWTDGDRLLIYTGRIGRVWRRVAGGLATLEVHELKSGRRWEDESGLCDWQLPTSFDAGQADLVALTARTSDDEGFTSEHVEVEAVFEYADSPLLVRWIAWAYPGASGIRTQLSAKLKAGATPPAVYLKGALQPEPRVERVPLGDPSQGRRLIGYYNDTQNRNDTHLDLLKEETVSHPLVGREWCDWASAQCVESTEGGLALVKESHKCVNQPGYGTGGFECDERDGLSCTGWGLRVDELSDADFTPAWATWCIAWNGGDLHRATAFKSFDAVRFPVDPARDIYLQANTWGSRTRSGDCRLAAVETEVLKELEAVADLGIDILQIDDGWQVPPGHSTWHTDQAVGWRPHPKTYPQGWTNVRKRAAELGVKLGLWFAAQPVSLNELQENFDTGGFLQYKLDFADLRNRRDIENLLAKVRAFIRYTRHRARVNWDVTEISPRYGYFFAREYGSIYLENRKPLTPHKVVYRPHTELRDLWQLAKYLNIHRFQCTIQNVDLVDKDKSDASLHPHGYAVAMALMGIPLFFQETKLYSAEARAEVRSVVDVYKAHREAMSDGIVHPIGDKPDNASWSGFQCHIESQSRGYLTIFRERCNAERERHIRLGWIEGTTIRLTDLLRNQDRRVKVGPEGAVPFTIDDAPGFLYLRYVVEETN